MASLYSLTKGQEVEVWRILAQEFSKEDFEAIIRDPNLVVLMKAALPRNGDERVTRSANGELLIESRHVKKDYATNRLSHGRFR